MLSRSADARVRARFRVGAKRGVFRGKNGGGVGVFCTMAFGEKGWKAGGKTRKISPSGGNLCSFRDVAGRSVQDRGKVVQKLAGREDENHKLCTTLCAPLRLGTRIVQVSFPLGVRCVGVAVRRCAIRWFSLPPAEAGCPFRRRGRGRRRESAGCCARGLPPLPSPSPIAHYDSAVGGGGAAVGGLTRGEHTAGAGIALCTSAFAHSDSAVGGQGLGLRRGKYGALREGASAFALCTPPLHTVIRHTSGMVRHCARGRPPLPSPSPTLRTAARDTGAQRRGHSPGAADGRTIYYIYACAGARARTFCTGRRATMWITFPWITHCG